jgi:hypothetical protein
VNREDLFAWIVVGVLGSIAAPFLLLTLWMVGACLGNGGCS